MEKVDGRARELRRKCRRQRRRKIEKKKSRGEVGEEKSSSQADW